MKNLFSIKDTSENRISFYHLLIFLLTLPFDRFYSTAVLISFSIHSLIFFRRQQFRQLKKEIIILQSAFFITFISSLYAPSFSEGWEIASRQLAIFIFPLLFSLTRLDLKKYSPLILTGFAAGCALTVVYLYYDAINVIIYNRLSLRELFSADFVNHNFSLPIEMHATYLSMMLAIAFIHLLHQLFTVKYKKLLLIIMCIVILAGLIQLGSKSVLIALLFIINIFFPLFVLSGKQRKKFFTVAAAVSVLLGMLIFSIDIFRTRYIRMLKNDLFANAAFTEQHSRMDRWDAAATLIKHSPLIGTGSGTETPLLKELYFERKIYDAYLGSLNAHNQYLSFLIISGVFGLLIYLGTLFWGLRRSLKRKDIMLISFIVLVITVSLSEDMLDVNKGIFFYAFFFSLFALQKAGAPTLNVPGRSNLKPQ